MIPDYLPLSRINQFSYCARRFWYMYVQGEMIENAHVTRGLINHEQAHAPGYETTPAGVTIHRQIYVVSHKLGLTGICDLLEEHADGTLLPVEYKQGRQGKWKNDEAQLCAQALCLEEMRGTTIERGAIFYFGSRRRVEVLFDSALRETTRQLVRQMQLALAEGKIPPHTPYHQRCRGCSLFDVCLPGETKQLQVA